MKRNMFKDQSGNYKLKIAFDFDGTLTEPILYELAQRLIKRGHDVWIMTARTSYAQYLDTCRQLDIVPIPLERNIDLSEMAKTLGLEDKIIYTDSEEKKDLFLEFKFDILFDDEAEWHCNSICEAGGIAVHI
jgi:UDP:flavonoid glycosyltransferase YjiC (YdhE family)